MESGIVKTAGAEIYYQTHGAGPAVVLAHGIGGNHALWYGQIDALAVVCKSVDMDRAIFLTYAVVLLNKEGDAMGKAQSYGRMYAELTPELAQRTLRFWKLRREAEASVAA